MNYPFKTPSITLGNARFRSVCTVGCECGVAGLRDAPRAPFGSALSSGTHTKQVVDVRVKMEHQELGVFSNVRVLILRRVTTTVLQPVVLRGEVIVHLHANSRHYQEGHVVLKMSDGLEQGSKTRLTPAHQHTARSLHQLLNLDGWMRGHAAVPSHVCTKHMQQRVVQLRRQTRHVHQRRYLGQTDDNMFLQILYLFVTIQKS